jgi:hypothetical protein
MISKECDSEKRTYPNRFRLKFSFVVLNGEKKKETIIMF